MTYPTDIPAFGTATGTQHLDEMAGVGLAALANAHSRNVEGIATTLGTTAAGSVATVAARLTDIETSTAGKVDWALPTNAQTGTTYTFDLADAKKLTTASNGSSSTYTIPPQSSVTWVADTVLRIVNLGAGVVTIAGGSEVTVQNTATTLAQYAGASLIRTGSDAWTLVPFSSAASGGASLATYSATTGSPTITTPGGKTCVDFTGSGSITTSAGFVRYLLIGAASYDVSYPYGNAGDVRDGYLLLTAGTHTITIGANGSHGGASSIGAFAVTAASAIGFNAGNAQGAGGTTGDLTLGFVSDIDGTSTTYARAQVASPVASRGEAGTGSATDGRCILVFG